MKLSEEIKADFDKVREHGDITELMKLTGIKSISHMGQILAGTCNTKITNIEKIKAFVVARKKTLTKINS
jgi:hypothetical protein